METHLTKETFCGPIANCAKDSPFSRNVSDSPFLRAQEAQYGQSSSFSLGPAMHESGGYDASSSSDTSQGTADLTAFVQNLLQQMQLRFQAMSDAILVRIDEMASRIEDLERCVDEVLREVTSSDDQVPLPAPSISPIRRANVAPPSPDVRKSILGASSSFSPASPIIGRYPSAGTLTKTTSLNLPDPRRQNNPLDVPNSPDFRRHSASKSVFPPMSPDLRRQSLPSSFGSSSPDRRKAISTAQSNVPNSPDARRRLETHLR